MRVVVETVHILLDILVDDGVTRNVAHPHLQLRGIGQFAVQQQVGGFQEVALSRQLFDGVAAVAKNPFFAVDERDGALAGFGVGETRVIGQQAEVGLVDLDLSQLQGVDRRPVAGIGAVVDRQFVAVTGTIVGNSQGILRHDATSRPRFVA
jgi:hypothetical protein